MKTIQHIQSGFWVNMHGHDCDTQQDFDEYIAAFPEMRVADHLTEGEAVDPESENQPT